VAANFTASSGPIRSSARNADLWSACIGGAAPEADYRAAIDAAGLRIDTLREVPGYQFLTTQAQNASRTYGVRAITLTAHKI
jgi:arsenite methyltransferase